MSTRNHTRFARPGYTMAELLVALAVFAVLALIVTQAIIWSLRERTQRIAHHTAIEIAVNVLEEAKALKFEHVTKDWADGQMIPSESAELLPEGKIRVTIEEDKLAVGTKRITAEVGWHFGRDTPPQTVTLTTVLSRREVKTGGKR